MLTGAYQLHKGQPILHISAFDPRREADLQASRLRLGIGRERRDGAVFIAKDGQLMMVDRDGKQHRVRHPGTVSDVRLLPSGRLLVLDTEGRGVIVPMPRDRDLHPG